MSDHIGMTITGIAKTDANLRRAVGGIRDAQWQGVRRGTLLVERALKLEMTAQGEVDSFWGKRGATGDGLSVRTGRTRASVTSNAFRVGQSVVGVVGSKAAHLPLHERGAVVKGTSPAGYARIPTAAAQTGAGVDKNAGRSIRDIPGSFLFTSRAGKLWAALRQGARGRLVLLYLLVKEYTLRPRGIFARTARTQTRPVLEAVGSEVSLVVQQANS